MGRRRKGTDAPSATPPVTDPVLRDQGDSDPLVEALTERLRRQFPASLSYDEWGRPVAYRHVVRAALSALPPELMVDLAKRVSDPEPLPERGQPQAPDARVVDLTTARVPCYAGVGWPEVPFGAG